jgi:hypothetical protein
MKQTGRPRKLSQALHKNLDNYALGARAAGIGLLVLSAPGEAKVVFTPAHVRISQFHLDLNHDGADDFLLQEASLAVSQTYQVFALRVTPANPQNRVWGQGNYALALSGGVRVGSRFPIGGQSMVRDIYKINSFQTQFNGAWANDGKGQQNRYLGLQFQINGQKHFGWARLTVEIPFGGKPTALLTGYAYETIPGKPILTGQTHSIAEVRDFVAPAAAFPTLGALALGGSTLVAWRREDGNDVMLRLHPCMREE